MLISCACTAREVTAELFCSARAGEINQCRSQGGSSSAVPYASKELPSKLAIMAFRTTHWVFEISADGVFTILARAVQ